MNTIVVKIINQSESWSYKLTNFTIFFTEAPDCRNWNWNQVPLGRIIVDYADMSVRFPPRFSHLCCFPGISMHVLSAACWGEESIEGSQETIGWFPKNWIVRLIMDGLWFENGECRESQNGAAINEEKWARAKIFKISWCELWVLIYKFSEYAENDIHWSFSWRITHVFNVSCGHWSLPKANPSCAEEFEIVLQSRRQLYENLWRTKISATDVNFESFECGLVVWKNFEHVVCSISNLDFNHQPLVFDTAAFKSEYFLKTRDFQPLKQNHGTHWFSEPRDG